MDPNDYQRACERTAPISLDARARLVDFALGLGAEAAAEVLVGTLGPGPSQRWFTSELGDCLWYTAMLAAVLEIPFAQVVARAPATMPTSDRQRAACTLVTAVGAVQERIRTHLYHDALLSAETAVELLASVVGSLDALASTCNVDLTTLMRLNLAKLHHRYPPDSA